MNDTERVRLLNDMLLDEMPAYRSDAAKFPQTEAAQRRLLRSLMNVRPPRPAAKKFLAEQDILLQNEARAKGIVTLDGLTDKRVFGRVQLILWQGDITRLAVDAIVNAANSALLGCFIPCHACIDNAIHSAAGIQLREACAQIMREQGHEEPTGQAKITPAFNLPCRYVLHTVGPIIYPTGDGLTFAPTEDEKNILASCYRACLTLAAKHALNSVAFCCISTGEFHFPNEQAAAIAVKTVKNWLTENDCDITVIFDVFKDEDKDIYTRIMNQLY